MGDAHGNGLPLDVIEEWLLDEERLVVEFVEARGLPNREIVQEIGVRQPGGTIQIEARAVSEWAGLSVKKQDVEPSVLWPNVTRVIESAAGHLAIPFYGQRKDAVRNWASAALQEFFKISTGRGDQVAAADVATKLAIEIESPTWPVVHRIRIGNTPAFELEADGFTVRPPTERELGDSPEFSRPDDAVAFAAAGWGVPTLVVEHRSHVPRSDLAEAPITDEPIQNLLSALILEDASFQVLGPRVTTMDVLLFRDFRTWGSGTSGIRWSGDRELTSAFFVNATELLPKLTGASPRILRACKRIRESTTKGDRGDRIVDLVVALEGLLTESRDQLGYQFRLHGALLLETELAARQAVLGQLKKGYNERSKIVHNNEPTDWSPAELRSLENLARRICLKFVNQGEIDLLDLTLGV